MKAEPIRKCSDGVTEALQPAAPRHHYRILMAAALVVSSTLEAFGSVPEPSLRETQAWRLCRVGLDSTVLAACEVSSQGVATVTAALADASQHFDAEYAASASMPALRSSLVRITQMGVAGGSSADALAQRDVLQTQLEAKMTERSTRLAALRGISLTSLASQVGAENATVATRMIANRHRRVPDAFKALDLGTEAWPVLEAACRKSERGLELSSAETTALNAAQTSALVQAVAARIEANAPAIEAWMHQQVVAAVTGQP